MKRTFDVGAAAIALVVLGPVLLVVAVVVLVDSGPPIFFRQWRIGRYGRPFRLLKFRSMRVQPREGCVNVSPAGDPRVTRVGGWLRNSHLDELPQLVNVLRGEMSLVGPRPETPEFVRLYNDEELGVLRIRPGIAGPSTLRFMDEAQRLARVADPADYYQQVLLHERVQSDLEYLDRSSLRYDIALLAHQLAALVGRR